MLDLDDCKLPIVAIQRHKINSDGKGIRTLIHSYGCNLNCKWCCNPETRFGNKFTNFSVNDLFQLLKIDDLYFLTTNGGVTFSGGEPLLRHQFIKEFSKKCKEMNWTVDIESAFHINKEVIDDILPFVDEFFIDIKTMNNEIHKKYVGVPNSKILENISYLSKKIDTNRINISVPIIPNINDSEENLLQTIDFMKRNKLNNITLLPYRDYSENKYKKLNLDYELNVTYNQIQYDKLLKIIKDFK